MSNNIRGFVDVTAKLGENVTIWRFANVMADVVIGNNVSIGGCAEIGKGTTIGDGTRISYGVFLPYNSRVGKNVFIAPAVTFTDDRYPRANNIEYKAEPPVIEDGASIGAGAVILPGVRIGRNALVGAGSVVAQDVPEATVVRGEPARVLRKRIAANI